MDNKLRTTIDNIIRLSKQNPEFNAEMRKYFGDSGAGRTNAHDDAAIKEIEKYLALDFDVDKMTTSIDYSYIKEPTVKNQLESDNREMMRFRYGTRYHEIIFTEFCRYAQLQGEMLLNYFYDTIEGGDIGKIKKHIQTYNGKAKFKDELDDVSQIGFSIKEYAFSKEFEMKSWQDWDHIRQTRNALSHRSPEDADKDFVSRYTEKMKKIGYELQPNGWLANDDKLSEDQKNAFKYVIQPSVDYKKFKYESWLMYQPFDAVLNAVSELNNLVRKNL